MKKQEAGTATAEVAEPTVFDIGKHDELRYLGFRTVNLASGWSGHEILGDIRIGPYPTHSELITAVKEHVQRAGVSDAVKDGGEFDEIERVIGEAYVDKDDIGEDDIDEDEIDAPPLADDKDPSVSIIHEGETIFEGKASDITNAANAIGENIVMEADSQGNRYLDGMAPVVNREMAVAIGNHHAAVTEFEAAKKVLKTAEDLLEVACHKHEDLFIPDPENSDWKIYQAGDLCAVISMKEKISTKIVPVSEDEKK